MRHPIAAACLVVLHLLTACNVLSPAASVGPADVWGTISEVRPAKFADLKTGQRVQARFTGLVATFSPPQATASEVVILR